MNPADAKRKAHVDAQVARAQAYGRIRDEWTRFVKQLLVLEREEDRKGAEDYAIPRKMRLWQALGKWFEFTQAMVKQWSRCKSWQLFLVRHGGVGGICRELYSPPNYMELRWGRMMLRLIAYGDVTVLKHWGTFSEGLLQRAERAEHTALTEVLTNMQQDLADESDPLRWSMAKHRGQNAIKSFQNLFVKGSTRPTRQSIPRGGVDGTW